MGKADAVRIAEESYNKATARVSDIKSFLETSQTKGTETDSRWAKMQSEGVLRAVPLVRQYNMSSSNFQPPEASAYRFKYKFSYKGAAVKKPAPDPVAEENKVVEIIEEI